MNRKSKHKDSRPPSAETASHGREGVKFSERRVVALQDVLLKTFHRVAPLQDALLKSFGRRAALHEGEKIIF